MDDLFYDVPYGIGRPLNSERCQMIYALFSCPFEAMSFASRNSYMLPNNTKLCVNRREWSPNILENALIVDYREESN